MRQRPCIERTWLLAIAALVSMVGCASSRATSKSEIPPAKRAVAASRSTVRASIREGFHRTEKTDPFRFRVRYNPPRCRAPAFEIWAHGRWTRVWLDGPKAIHRRLDTYKKAVEENSGPSRGFEVEASPSGARQSETGLTYPVFKVRAFGDQFDEIAPAEE